MTYHLYWGDLHNHNSVGLYHYSKGSLERTIEIAQSHLDFFAFTGHSQWHDMPSMPNDGHLLWQEGFDHHSRSWPQVKQLIRSANRDGAFVALLGYEWHSAAYGDRSVLFADDEGDLIHADTIQELTEYARSRSALLIPHHIGYKSGLPGRGANWDAIDESVSPLLEIYSEHGGSERDRGPWPYIRHTNGPRTTLNTLQEGLSRGKRLGVICSTDDHFGVPGAYGEGLAGVYAERKTRASIWQALRARRTVGVTGDRIELLFQINGAMMGTVLPSTTRRQIEVAVRGWDEVAMVEVLKGTAGGGWPTVIHRVFPEDAADRGRPFAGPVKCRIEFGWGPWKALGISRTTDWRMGVHLTGGRMRAFQPCFQSGPMDEERRNRVITFTDQACHWQSYTRREGSFAETPTNAVVLEIEGSPETRFDLALESPVARCYSYRLGDLARSSQVEFTGDFPCESLLVHRLAPEDTYISRSAFEDAGSPGDYYYARATQANGHMAWSSPIWIGE